MNATTTVGATDDIAGQKRFYLVATIGGPFQWKDKRSIFIDDFGPYRSGTRTRILPKRAQKSAPFERLVDDRGKTAEKQDTLARRHQRLAFAFERQSNRDQFVCDRSVGGRIFPRGLFVVGSNPARVASLADQGRHPR